MPSREIFGKTFHIAVIITHHLHATVAPALGHPVNVLLESVHVGVLHNVGAGLFDGRPHVLDVLDELVDQTLG